MHAWLFILILIAAFPAFADVDDGLYDPRPPAGSAFVRFLNVAEGTDKLVARAGGKAYDPLNYKEMTPYYVVPQGQTTLQLGSVKTVSYIEEGHFYTVVTPEMAGDLLVLEEPVNESRFKATLVFYNFESEKPVTLKTQDGKYDVIPHVAHDDSGTRDVNAVKLNTAIHDDTGIIANPQEVILERGLSYALIYADDEPFWVQAKTDTRR